MRGPLGFAFLLLLAVRPGLNMSVFEDVPEQTCDEKEEGPLLWSVAGRDASAHFFGTIHVPYSLVWGGVGAAAKRAFAQADAVFFELDLARPDTAHRLAQCQMLPPGKSLSEILPEDLYLRLKSHLDYVKLMIPSWTKDENRGMYSEYLFKAITGNWERKRPVWALLLAGSLSEGEVRASGQPVLDLFLAREAARMRKATGAVERVREQCDPLNALHPQQVLSALNETLGRLERARDRPPAEHPAAELVRRYNCRSLAGLHDSAHLLGEGSGEAAALNAYFRRELIEKRNARMAARAVALLQQFPQQSFFFAFGAGHFLGNGSVLDHVRESGYQVARVVADDTPRVRSYRRPHHHPRPHGDPLWGEDDFRPARRRHHHSVHLLRSQSTPAPLPHMRRNNFNDLWVKMDRSSNPKPPISPITPKKPGDSKSPWSSTVQGISVAAVSENCFLLTLCSTLVALLRTRCYSQCWL